MNSQKNDLINTPNLSLEASSQQLQEMVEKAARHIAAHLEALPDMPSINNENGAALSQRLKEPLPQYGVEFNGLLEDLFQQVIPCSFTAPAPHFMGYIPGGGIVHSAIADLIANAVNRYVTIWAGAPGLVQIETNVLRWFCDIVGLPTQAGGVLTTGGSMANFSATVAAREDRLPENFLKGVLYVSDQTHHSVQKAAMLAGFPAANVRVVPSETGTFSIKLDALRQMIAEDREAGWQPFMLTGSAGTTNSGAVDNLQGLADIAEAEGMWFHVDGAYGAFFMLTEAGRTVMRGIERADSVTLDPHKGLFLPYGTGALLVRDLDTLRKSHSSEADYMPAMQDNPDFVDYCELSPELTRDFRGLRVWLPFKLHGIGPFRDNLEEKLQLSHWATEELRNLDDVEIVAEPQLSIVAFRYRPPGMGLEELNRLNKDLLDRIVAKKRVFLSGTMLHGVFVIRICVLSFRTHLDHVRQCLDDIKAAIAELS